MVVKGAGTVQDDVLEGSDITLEELRRRKEFLEFGDTDVERLVSLRKFAQQSVPTIVEEFYKLIMSHSESRSFFQDPQVLNRVKQAQTRQFEEHTSGSYEREYAAYRIKIGRIHQNIGLKFDIYLGAYRRYLESFARHLFNEFKNEPAKALEGLLSLLKLVFLDVELAADTYFRTIRLQKEAIYELATPVMQVREGLLICPIIGVIDTHRARQLTETILHAIRNYRAKVIVIDITGVPLVDSKVANHLVQTVEAGRLMGANAIVTGLSPEVAQSLVVLGVNLGNVRTVADLQGGIEEGERYLGYRVTKVTDVERNGHSLEI